MSCEHKARTHSRECLLFLCFIYSTCCRLWIDKFAMVSHWLWLVYSGRADPWVAVRVKHYFSTSNTQYSRWCLRLTATGTAWCLAKPCWMLGSSAQVTKYCYVAAWPFKCSISWAQKLQSTERSGGSRREASFLLQGHCRARHPPTNQYSTMFICPKGLTIQKKLCTVPVLWQQSWETWFLKIKVRKPCCNVMTVKLDKNRLGWDSCIKKCMWDRGVNLGPSLNLP